MRFPEQEGRLRMGAIPVLRGARPTKRRRASWGAVRYPCNHPWSCGRREPLFQTVSERSLRYCKRVLRPYRRSRRADDVRITSVMR